MARGYQAAEVRIGAGPVAGLVSRVVADKLKEQRTLYGSKYEENSRLYQGWPSALSRELELKRALALNPNAVFRNEKDDKEFELNQSNIENMIKGMPIEMAVVYDKYNRLIGMTRGGKDSVSADVLPSQMEGATFIHNHPEDGPLSPGDIAGHVFYKTGESVALSKEGKYSVMGGKGATMKEVKDAAMEAHTKAFPRAYQFVQKYLKPNLSPEQVEKLKAATTWNDFKSSLPQNLTDKAAAIIHKHANETAMIALSRYGLRMKFEPVKNFKEATGFDSYESVPNVPVN
jgi:hypothetical protein